MEASDTKLALDEIKLNFTRISNNLLKQIPILAFIGTVLMIIFTLSSHLVLKDELLNHITFLTPDIYTLISILGFQLASNNISSAMLASFTIIFAIAFLVVLVIVSHQIYYISKNFWSLSKIDITLKQSRYVYLSIYVYVSFTSISYILPSFGWIIAIIIANIALFVGFFYFHQILKKYEIRLQILKDTSIYMGVSSAFNIIAYCLVFIDISFLLVSVIGYLFLFLGFRRFKTQVQFIAPIVRDAPPPPTIAAPVGPAPRPTIGPQIQEITDDVPSPSDQ